MKVRSTVRIRYQVIQPGLVQPGADPETCVYDLPGAHYGSPTRCTKSCIPRNRDKMALLNRIVNATVAAKAGAWVREAATRKHGLIVFLALVPLAALPYLNTLANGFVYDDGQQILENPYVHSFRYIGRIFGSTVWSFEGAQGVSNYYRPAMSLAYLICYKVFGPSPFGFHLVNLLLHLAVTLLYVALTEHLFKDRLLSLIAATLFALHPIHTESVAWIAGITDLEVSTFFLTTFLLYVRLPGERTERGRWRTYSLMLIAYGLALLSKEQALVLPTLALVYEHGYCPASSAAPLREKWSRYLPLLVAGAAYLLFRKIALGGFAPVAERPDLTNNAVLYSAVALAGGYLWKLVWPAPLTAFYVFHETRSISDSSVLAALTGMMLCTFLFVWMWRRARPVSFAFLWVGATLVPVLNARWMPAQVFAERYLYLPSMGFCWLVGWAAATVLRWTGTETQSASRKALRQIVPLTFIVIAGVYTVIVIQRNRDWRNDEVLYRRTLEVQPDAQLIRTGLGAVYAKRGDWDAAEHEWILALGPAKPYAATLSNLGLLRMNQKRYREATDLFSQAIRLRPQYLAPHLNLAEMYVKINDPVDADREFRTAVSLAPLNTYARNSYARFLLSQRRFSEARVQFADSAAADPKSQALDNFGVVDSAEEPAKGTRPNKMR